MSVRIVQGHVVDALMAMPPESVHCVVTSPPYWGLRSYGTEPQVWHGVAACDHEWGDEIARRKGGAHGNGVMLAGGRAVVAAQAVAKVATVGSFCQRCGAWRGEHGLEPTVEMYVAHSVQIFREVRRVLRGDGTLWLNIGDCYAGSWSGNSLRPLGGDQRPGEPGFQPLDDGRYAALGGAVPDGLKPKDRVGVPHRLAFALQADGWWWRDEIVWWKPNPIPSSIKDRTCPAHEFVMMFAKARRYHYDNTAIMEPIAASTIVRLAQPNLPNQPGGPKQDAYADGGVSASQTRTPREIIKDFATLGANMRQKRSVWPIATQPFKGAHFATFPPALVEPCIKAGCPDGGTVLDPFGGSGTVGVVASRLGRGAVLIELNPEFAAMAKVRIEADAGMFAGTSVEAAS